MTHVTGRESGSMPLRGSTHLGRGALPRRSVIPYVAGPDEAATVAEKRFRRLDAPHRLRDVHKGRKFVDGRPVPSQQQKAAA